MKKLADAALILLICFFILEGQVGVCLKNEVQTSLEDPTTQKPGFFTNVKNFFTGTKTPSTALPQDAMPQQKPPPLKISEAPLMPLGPRPDTPSSSPFNNQPNQPPQWPSVGSSSTSITSTTTQQRPANVAGSSNLSGGTIPQQSFVGNTNGQHLAPNIPFGYIPNRPEKVQPSGIDLSYGGGSTGGRYSPSGNRPAYGLAPITSSTTTTTVKTPQSQQPSSPQKPQTPEMNIDLRFGSSSSTTSRTPPQQKDTVRRPSIDARDEFPPLPSSKSQSPQPGSPQPGSPQPGSPQSGSPQPASPSVWNGKPKPPSTESLSRPNSPPLPEPNNNKNRVSFIPSNGPGTQSRDNTLRATDEELQQLTENLYTKEVNSQLNLIQVNIQGKTRSIDSTDAAPNPLLVVDNRALQAPTIVKLRALFNNYEPDTLVNEHVAPNERQEENEFVDAIVNTNVMRQAMLFLQNKGVVTADPRTHKDLIKELWFTQYSRGQGKVGSSGFEHVFVNEVKNGTIIGLHNWVYFYDEEKAGRLDYKGYMSELNLGTKAKVLKARFTHNGLNKPVNTLFIGSSPELEIALYTVCFKLRPDRTCPVSLGNSKFGIVTYSWRYRGKNLIGSAYPEI